MVKGVTRQVIVVKSPDPELFEQAIFLIRNNALPENEVTEEALLRQAKTAALRFHGKKVHLGFSLRSALSFLAGACLVSLIWIISLI